MSESCRSLTEQPAVANFVATCTPFAGSALGHASMPPAMPPCAALPHPCQAGWTSTFKLLIVPHAWQAGLTGTLKFCLSAGFRASSVGVVGLLAVVTTLTMYMTNGESLGRSATLAIAHQGSSHSSWQPFTGLWRSEPLTPCHALVPPPAPTL